MVKFLKSVFSRSKSIDDILDKENGHIAKAGQWIDHWSYTSEEQAKDRQKLIEGVQKFAVDTMIENTDRSKARRDLAVFIIKFFALLLFLSGVTFPINPDWSEYWFKLATQTNLGTLVLGVGAFFWGSHLVRTRNS